MRSETNRTSSTPSFLASRQQKRAFHEVMPLAAERIPSGYETMNPSSSDRDDSWVMASMRRGLELSAWRAMIRSGRSVTSVGTCRRRCLSRPPERSVRMTGEMRAGDRTAYSSTHHTQAPFSGEGAPLMSPLRRMMLSVRARSSGQGEPCSLSMTSSSNVVRDRQDNMDNIRMYCPFDFDIIYATTNNDDSFQYFHKTFALFSGQMNYSLAFLSLHISGT